MSHPRHQAIDLNLAAQVCSGVLLATISGSAELDSRHELEQFLVSVHEQALQAQLRSVELDVRNLMFLNSSSLKAFVRWVTQIKDLPAEQRYRVTFLSSPDSSWQKRSLPAIAVLAAEIVTIEALPFTPAGSG